MSVRELRRFAYGLVCAAMMAAVPQTATAIGDGNQLLDFGSKRRPDPLVMLYSGYVWGIADTMRTLELICHDVSYGDVDNAVLLWMRRNPDKLDAPAWSVVFVALKHHFPCD